MESDALSPVINPVVAISCVSRSASVKPASAPVSSTSASLKPSTIEPT